MTTVFLFLKYERKSLRTCLEGFAAPLKTIPVEMTALAECTFICNHYGAIGFVSWMAAFSISWSLKKISCGVVILSALFFNNTISGEATGAASNTANPKIASAVSSLLSRQTAQSLAQEKKNQPKLSLVSLSINNKDIADTEVIVWDDGHLSVPMKVLGNVFDLSPQVSTATKTLYLINPQTHNQLAINWETGVINNNGEVLPATEHQPVQINDSMLASGDVYIDLSTAQQLLHSKIHWSPDEMSLSVETDAPLSLLKAHVNQNSDEKLIDQAPIQTIASPNILHAAVEKLTINQHSTAYSSVSTSPFSPLFPQVVSASHAVNHTLSLGVSGRIGNWDYQFKPTMVGYNSQASLQSLDGYAQKQTDKHQIRIGSMDAGLSNLVSPNLPLWGIRLASLNAVQTGIQSGNDTTQSVNTDGLLKQNEKAYSIFMGRTPVQFYPLVATGPASFLLPQSNKWVAGTRYFTGVTNKLTLGVSTAVDRIIGAPRSPSIYSAFFSQLSPDLTGLSSYRRDPNYFQGETAAVTARYRLAKSWTWSSDAGVSHYNLLAGTNLPIASTAIGKAITSQIAYKGKSYSAGVKVFNQDANYYTPTTFYTSAIYDRRGAGVFINGRLQHFLKLNYALQYDYFQTNLGHIISGGLIQAHTLTGSLTRVLGAKTTLNANFNWTTGHNAEKEYVQRNTDVCIQRILPFHLTSETHYTQFLSNNLLLGALTSSVHMPIIFFNQKYQNNAVTTAINIPAGQNLSFKLGTQVSTLLNNSFLKATVHIKNVTLEPVIQQSYGSIQKQNILGIRLAYRFKSGKELGINYSNNLFNYAFNKQMAATVSPIHSHQFYVDFVDVLAMVNHKMQSLGVQADNKGVLSGNLFVDLNRDNQLNDAEPGVKNVALLIDNKQTIYTDRHGDYMIKDLSPGYHTVQLINEQIPLTLTPNETIYNINVAAGKVQQVNIALTPEGGQLTGHVHVQDVDRKNQNPDGLVLVLLDKSGKVANYTVADAKGYYKFSRIPNGDYKVDMEAALKSSGKYKVMQSPDMITVRPSRHYQTLFQKDNLDFDVVSL